MNATVMKTTALHGVFAIAIGALAGLIVGGVIEDLAHTVHFVEMYYRDGTFPAEFPDSALISDMIGAGTHDRFVAGAVAGFVGFVGAILRGVYRAAYGDALARDNCGSFVSIAFAVVVSFLVFVLTGEIGFVTVASVFAAAIGGCVAGAVVGTVSADF